MKTPPDSSVGPLMDARDRRELLRAWTTPLCIALFAVAVSCALQFLPAVKEPKALDGVVFNRAADGAMFHDLFLEESPVAAQRYFLSYPPPKFDDTNECLLVELVELPGNRLVGSVAVRSGRDYNGVFWGIDGVGLFAAEEFEPDTLRNRLVRAALALHLPEWIAEEEATLIGELPLTGGPCVRLGAVPFRTNTADISPDRSMALCVRESNRSLSLPGFRSVEFYPAMALVSLKDGTVKRELPLPGHAYFLNDRSALCLAPVGIVQVDLETGEYELVCEVDPDYRPEIFRSRRYQQAGRSWLGVLQSPLEEEGALAMRIEMSDPPRVEQLPLAVPGDQVTGINYARGLAILESSPESGTPSYHLVDWRSGEVLLSRERNDVADIPRFVGEDYLQIRDPIELPPLAGPVLPDARQRNPESYALYDCCERCRALFGDDVQTTRTKLVYREIPLDHLLRTEGSS
jgi:hypothetical protein